MEHLDRCKEHEAAAERMAHLQKFPTRSPMPQTGDMQQTPVKTEGLDLLGRIY